MSGVVIDASVLSVICAEIRSSAGDEKGPLELLLEDIKDQFGIATNRFTEQEWRETCGYQYVDSLLAEWAKEGKLVEMPTDGRARVRSLLTRECGLPRESPDFNYVDCARRVEPFYVFAEDIDLYEPAEKYGSRPAKTKARQMREGCLVRFVDKQYGVTVGCYCHVRRDLCLGDSTTAVGSHPCFR